MDANANGRSTLRAHGPSNEVNPFKRGGSPSVALGQLYQRTSRSGRTYLVGRLGTAKLVVVSTGADSRGSPIWEMFLGETRYVDEDARALGRQVKYAEAP